MRRRGFKTRSSLCLVAAFLVAAPLEAQQSQNAPHAGYVYPAGGQQGTTFETRVGGRFLDGATGVVASGRGIRAEVVGHDKPMTGQQITELREKLQALQKRGNTPALQKQVADARLRIGDSLRRNANPTIGEIVTLKVTIARDAEPGPRQLRLVTPLGLTNPLVFSVGQLPEFREKDEKRTRADSETMITLPAVVNGRLVPGDVDRVQFPLRQPQQYMPGDVDRYRFHAVKGQKLVMAVAARDLMPYLADAVPGWFQATLTLYDPNGREVAYEDDYRFQPDPVLRYEVPADGDYVVEIRDALYRGREDFVYRLTVGELPFITSVFPLGVRSGAKSAVTLSGWNLPSSALTVDARGMEPGIHTLPIREGDFAAGPVALAVDSLPEVLEKEPNDAPDRAQPLSLPVVVNGRIGQPGDRDVFSFRGRAGDQVVAEVSARRLGSPLDSVLDLTDAAGRRLAWNDDHEDSMAGLITHHADSLLTTRLPASSTYYLRIGDAQHRGGNEYGYRLRVSAPKPDFDLRVSPSDLNVAGNGHVPITVYVSRQDGFTGDIVLELKDAPGGFRLSGGVIPAGCDRIRVTLTAPPNASGDPVIVRVEGHATIQGRTVVRRALPADEMMQAFAYQHLVTADELRVMVSGRGGTRIPITLVGAQAVRIQAGGSVQMRVDLPPGYLAFENLQFDIKDPPDGIALRDVAVDSATRGIAPPTSFPGRGRGLAQARSALGAQFALHADATRVKPGLRGNLIVTVSGERSGRGNQQGAAPRRIVLGTLPAIAFEVIQP